MSNILNHNYSTNGRSGENINFKSTKIKSADKEYSSNNGRLFNKSYKKQLFNENVLTESKGAEKKNLFSWVVDTLNPINHIPLINTLNKLNKVNKEPLDIVQSAIGGVIYGGGVVGIAKGLGGWFVGKLLPEKLVIADNKSERNKDQNFMGNGKVANHTSSKMLRKVNLKETTFPNILLDNNKINEHTRKNQDKIEIINIKKNNKNYYEFYDKNKKIINKAIDTKA